jgi:hypothetical protein
MVHFSKSFVHVKLSYLNGIIQKMMKILIVESFTRTPILPGSPMLEIQV